MYTYTVEALAPCVDDVAELTITISEAANAGSNGAIVICENSNDEVDLQASLGGTPDLNGVWTMPDGTAFNGVFIPGETGPGTYTYTVNAPAPCPAVSAAVLVDVVPVPVAEFSVDGAGACTPGANRERIVANVSELLENDAIYKRMSRAHNPYGDGKACERIIHVLRGI